ncbi:hypothetical protein GGR56DRAFT_64202 [Xylariaceae sp. FL0804]|nr:hypothetical protein GGR56DRAFT_64202 [Xylariaceae sp. FL0804]
MQTASGPHAHPAASASAPYPLPASPTLTNPDMILPDYGDPASSPDRPPSPLDMWKNAHDAEMQFDLSSENFVAGPLTPTTPIIYGNGTMLSDIGEVTEVESTCPTARSRSGSIRKPLQPMSNPMISYESMKKLKEAKATRERRTSIDSTSTVNANDHPAMFADFDDAVSVDDSNFQGDDEDSVADSYIDDGSVQESISPARAFPSPFPGEKDSSALSRRAEQILANAKRRLNTMEGNLSRARTSLYSPTFSMGSGSTPSPTMGRSGAEAQHLQSPGARKGTKGHTRVASTGSLPVEGKSADVPVPRSLSALGTAGGYRQPSQSSRNAGPIPEDSQPSPQGNSIYGNMAFAKSKMSLVRERMLLEPLSEDDVSDNSGPARPTMEEDVKLDTFLSPTFGSYSDKGLRRSASTAQMRDLKDQMKDLKGRLSSLRDRARADNLQRRSLQSLRTPSPFTHARVEQWYAQTNGADDGASVHDEPIPPPMDSNARAPEEDRGINEAETEEMYEDEESSEGGFLDANESIPATRLTPIPPERNTKSTPRPDEADVGDEDDMKTEDGSDNEDAYFEDEFGSESGASSYHDSVQNQVSHEDREDAFDYEHFFLHSAMGSMSQRRMNKREEEDGYSSEDSVETTRGPATSTTTEMTATKNRSRSRRGSESSISTVDSFATATEDGNTQGDESSDGHFPGQVVTVPGRPRTHTPETARPWVSGSGKSDSGSDHGQWRLSAVGGRPQSSDAADGGGGGFQHRPSVASLDSAGTTRSFPLVNRPKMNNGAGGMLTPSDSPDYHQEELKRQISDTLLNETASLLDHRESSPQQHFDQHGQQGQQQAAAPISMLQRADQILVERLVASLGRCVLGLTESGRASTESRAYRRRIEAARQLLEGSDNPV